ncbi:MFS transporter [Taibaiella chishuiensis]|uniref:Putative MFS family arabinose efflux permease n=1 Tax=Taibaiella chishuiensis TaxID=1434707 RepID=A0A2P8D660_9BACT|nr:MFS transporter [Taibaiella chishuiensis]PSK92715.1 putative MFS family arabinose efflux permease [Taibaiella chishuiensis]
MTMFRSFKYYNYRLHITGQFVSLIGTWMQRVAISWLVYRITGSAFLLGLVSFLSLIPSLVLSPYAGSFVDRHNKYRVVKATQLALMIQAGAMALLVWLKWYSIPAICLLSLAQGIIAAFDNTGRQSMMAEIVPEKEDLPNAIALNSSVFNAARLIGPAIAGVTLSTIGEEACFLINFLSFIVVLVCLFYMKLDKKTSEPHEQDVWSELRDGYQYLKAEPDQSSLIVLLACSSLVVIPFTTLLPVIAKQVFNGNAETFSWFESAGGLGAMAGAIYMAALKPGRNIAHITIVASFLFAIGLILLAFSPTLVIALICTMLATIGMMIQTSSINTYLQTHSLPEMRGRTVSYYLMAFQGMLPVGSLLVGFMAERWGLEYTLAFEGVAGIILIAAYQVYYRKRIVPRVQLQDKPVEALPEREHQA